MAVGEAEGVEPLTVCRSGLSNRALKNGRDNRIITLGDVETHEAGDRWRSARRMLDITEVDDWAFSEVSAPTPLTVLDLRTTGLLKFGVSTNAARAKSHAMGRRLSKALYDRFAIDGILHASRLTSAECVAVYDRAVPAGLVATPAESLVRNPPRGSKDMDQSLWVHALGVWSRRVMESG